MLDSATKRRIDTARDILVGKVPDPKSQVEQITIALIYKFMDDMDAMAEEAGGKRKFFAGEFKKFGWANLMSPATSGEERIALYAEGMVKMPQNPGVPKFFRDIFKNAFLPYRDPETLKLFLKEIDGFTYDHSERLGDAFEYLLSVLGSQGDAGQFRTPRHIIDFIVKVVDPKKTDTILDPACGTAGFLISAYKHIVANNGVGGRLSPAAANGAAGKDTRPPATPLTPDEKKKLAGNLKGYDISPDMVRLSLVNLYLHGFTAPSIEEYDTLTSQDKWNETADVILANPPFMSPKGGIKPHDKFSVKSKRSEVLFVDYMAEHLTSTGRAGIIVPEGIIFQSQNSYVQLRKMLVENYLIGVISLPSGVFMPYTGVKTSILIFDKQEAKRNPLILFSDVRHIGMSLGVKRTASEHNDLPDVLSDYEVYRRGGEYSRHSWTATRTEILANGCNLTGSRYRPRHRAGATEMARLDTVLTSRSQEPDPSKVSAGEIPLVEKIGFESGRITLRDTVETKTGLVLIGKGDLVFSGINAHKGAIAIFDGPTDFAAATIHYGSYIVNPDLAVTDYLWRVLRSPSFRSTIEEAVPGGVKTELKPNRLLPLEIPLPPLSVQKEIVAEIEGYQKVIDGARAVLDHYRPHIPIQPDWPMVELGEIVELASGRFLPVSKTVPGPYPVYGGNGSDRTHEEYFLEEPTIAIGRVGFKCGAVQMTTPKSWITDNALYVVRTKRPASLQYLLQAMTALQLNQFASTADLRSISQTTVNEKAIPLPPLPEQERIVAEIEAEQRLVAGNRELIERFETKIQQTLARVWGEAPAPATETSESENQLPAGMNVR